MKAKHHITMNAYFFGMSFMWNAIHPIVLPALLLSYVDESLKNTYFGIMTFVGLVLAMLVQPIAGGLSDTTRSRWGRRRPWLFVGNVLCLVCLGGMAIAGSFWGLVVAYICLQIASNCAHGPAQGLIPDLVPEKQHGLASGIKSLADMLGLVVASFVAGQLMSGDDPLGAFAVIGAALAIGTAATLLTTERNTQESITGKLSDSPQTGKKNPIRELVADLARQPGFAWLIVSRLLILLGIYAVQSFVQYYLRDVMRVANPPEATGNLLTTLGLPLTLAVFPAGFLSDRLGRRRMNLVAGAIVTLGILPLAFAVSMTQVSILAALIGIGTGVFLSANWALATDLIPQQEAGKYLGLTNLATAGAGALARLGGPLIDQVNALRPEAYWGYPTLFLLAAASALVGTMLLLCIHEPSTQPKVDSQNPSR
jgi:MFS family permease